MDEQLQHSSLELMRRADLVTPMALRAAATLRLPDHVDRGASTVEDLAGATGCHRRPLAKLVAHLCALDVLREDGGTYSVGELGRPLLSENEHFGMRAMLDLGHVLGHAEMSLIEMLHTLRTGDAAFEAANGRNFWEDLDSGPDDRGGIEVFASTPPRFDAELVVNAFDWSAVNSFVDVGGNCGAMTAALLTAHPHLRGTLIDLPCFARIAEKNMADAGLAERCDVVGTSFFDPLPAGADVYLLSAILADWNDGDALRILRRCAEAASSHGVVLLAEVHMTPSHPDPVNRTADALRLEISMGYPDRTVADLERLAREAGLAVTWRGPDSPVRSLLALRPQGSSGEAAGDGP